MICFGSGGIFGTLSLDFPVVAKTRDCLGDQVPGLRAGFGLGHSNRLDQSALPCPRVGSTTQPGEEADPGQ